MDEKKLERYLETKYELEDRDYRVRCDTGEKFFHVTVRHLEDDEPELSSLANELLDTLYFNEDRWDIEMEQGKDQSFIYAERENFYNYDKWN